MIAYHHIQCWCQRQDWYSAWCSVGSRLKKQPGPGAWRLLYVCVARQSVWVHRKPIETPAGYHCQPLIKRGKKCIGPPAATKRADRDRKNSFLVYFFQFFVFFVLKTCHFDCLPKEPDEIKHIKKAVVHSDHFYYKRNGGSRRKTVRNKRLQNRQEIAA